VDSYEIGTKWTLSGAVPGHVNVAFFYNELTDMQIQTGFRGAVNTTGITNAGQATIWGTEVETSLSLTDQLRLDLGYSYLNSNLDSYDIPASIPEFEVTVVPTAVEGDPLPLTPKNTVVASLTYLLPVPEDLGQVSVGATYVYTDDMLASTTSPFGVIPDSRLTNFNLNWNGIAGSRVDAMAFVTNAFDEEYITYVHGLYDAIGSEFYTPGMPRMYGVRIRYNFGASD
jgi:iron complex outermembrane receptor protein